MVVKRQRERSCGAGGIGPGPGVGRAVPRESSPQPPGVRGRGGAGEASSLRWASHGIKCFVVICLLASVLFPFRFLVAEPVWAQPLRCLIFVINP